jgi:hypothetical protein
MHIGAEFPRMTCPLIVPESCFCAEHLERAEEEFSESEGLPWVSPHQQPLISFVVAEGSALSCKGLEHWVM